MYDQLTQPNKAILLSASSGTGKSFVLKALVKYGALIAPSWTTRSLREGEKDFKDGGQYKFVTHEEFESGVRAGLFLEWVQVAGNLYGTPISSFDQGSELYVREVEISGVLSLQPKLHAAGFVAFSVFLLPPSYGHLQVRLRSRASEPESKVLERLEYSTEELKSFGANWRKFDLIQVVNESDRPEQEGDRIARAIIKQMRITIPADE